MKVELTIRSLARADGDEQALTQTANGFLRQFDDYTELSYREADGSEGLGNTLTTLRLYASYMELIRRGDYICVLTLEVGKQHDCLYQTPFGDLTLTTAATHYASSLDSDGHGTVTVSYTLNADTAYELSVTVTPLLQGGAS